jgi:kynurenine formamidase
MRIIDVSVPVHPGPGEYRLVCAPLKLVGSDGAPARVFLLRDS